MIESKDNRQIKNLRKLLAQAKERTAQKVFVTEGERLTREAPDELVEKIYVSESFEKQSDEVTDESGALIGVRKKKTAGLNKEKIEVVADDIFKSISDTVTPQGIMAVVRQPEYCLEDMTCGKLFVILDNIRDPGNIGTIIRTAEAAEVSCVILSPGCADIFSPKVIRSTMGSIFRVPFVVEEPIEAIKMLKEANVNICASCLDGAEFYDKVMYEEKTAFVIGNEANGIRKEITDISDVKVKIPMGGKVESLNAAVSCAVLLYGYRYGK